MTKATFMEKWNSKSNNRKILITVTKLPSGTYETAVNTEYLNEKFAYILESYNGDLQLYNNKKISIVDCIIL